MRDFGTYPTPIACLEQLSSATTTVWVKRDDLTNRTYGGSKVRKLGALLEDATSRGARKLLTVGTVGSHHVLATGVFGRLLGFQVEAVVLPQPQSPHVLETVRASIGQGVVLVPAGSYAEAARHLAVSAAAGAYSIPAGGSNLLGTRGMVAAAAELAEQVRAGALPEPDLIVLPLGSGGTAAGLSAGVLQAGLRTRVLAIAVAEPVQVFTRKAQALAKELVDHSSRAAVLQRLEIDRRYLGDGYGRPTRASQHAMREAGRVGLTLDDTYTAKAFAAVLERRARGTERHILYWHTLSSANISPLLIGAPEEQKLPSEVRRLAHA
jgi:1-aminocyclopropane-1-carboxylate deaminase/D-cysteine desulfhydrase-like pyridoxal-dependent ACC family enzyme